MAIVTRYFSTTGAGAADGTSWANRAALFSAGNWSSVISGFSFAGSDSLYCLVGPGTYTCSQSLTTAVANSTAANPIVFHACDSSGVLLDQPDPDWVSSQPMTTTGMPVIATTTNIVTTNLQNSFWRLIAFTASNCQGIMISSANLDWCSLTNSTNNGSAAGIAMTNNTVIRNSQIVLSGANFDYGIDFTDAAALSNVRIDGTAGTSGGSRQGAKATTGGIRNAEGLTIIGCAGGGFFAATGSATRFSTLRKSLIVNCGTYGYRGSPTSSQTVFHQVVDCVIVNGSAFGIDAQSQARILVSNCRLRDNTSGNFNGMGNYPTDMGVLTTAGTDADEFVDVANKDYRIKNTSTYWGKNLGPGDEPAAGGGGGSALHLGHLGQTGIGVF